MREKEIEIGLETGLEARPVALLVQVASQHESTVYIESNGKKVNAKSIMGMMTLGLDAGEEVADAEEETEGETEEDSGELDNVLAQLQALLEELG